MVILTHLISIANFQLEDPEVYVCVKKVYVNLILDHKALKVEQRVTR